MTPMNRFPILLLLCLAAQAAAAQTPALKVEDNSATPKTLLQVNTDAGLLVKGTFGTGVIPATGMGTRLMWYPKKAAFRAGSVDGTGTEWDDANVGDYSTAMGLNTRASGGVSTAMGGATTASGNFSTAMGTHTKASGVNSVAMGNLTTASGDYSTAMGVGTTASSKHAVAMGLDTRATAAESFAMGVGTRASAGISVALGWHTIAGSYAALVFGQYNSAGSSGVTPDAWRSTEPLLVAGNGSSEMARSDALVLYKNGNLWISGTPPQSSDARLKEDLVPLTGVLPRLQHLQPTYYRFREGTNRSRERQIGLLAQEVEEVFPELVSRGADGYLAVSYSNFSAVLVGAVKEQQQLIDRQQQEIEQLEAEVAALRTAMETRLAHVEAALATQPASGPATLRKAALSTIQDD